MLTSIYRYLEEGRDDRLFDPQLSLPPQCGTFRGFHTTCFFKTNETISEFDSHSKEDAELVRVFPSEPLILSTEKGAHTTIYSLSLYSTENIKEGI